MLSLDRMRLILKPGLMVSEGLHCHVKLAQSQHYITAAQTCQAKERHDRPTGKPRSQIPQKFSPAGKTGSVILSR